MSPIDSENFRRRRRRPHELPLDTVAMSHTWRNRGGSRGFGANGQYGDGSSDDSADETPPARDRSSFNEEI